MTVTWEPATRQAALDVIAKLEGRESTAEAAAQVATAYAALYVGDRLMQIEEQLRSIATGIPPAPDEVPQ